MEQKYCDQCENHCPADDLHCGKGRRYFGVESKEGEDRGHGPFQGKAEGPIGRLRQCGHMLHHGMTSGNDDLLSALSEQERAELERLLGKLVEDWESRKGSQPEEREGHKGGHGKNREGHRGER